MNNKTLVGSLVIVAVLVGVVAGKWVFKTQCVRSPVQKQAVIQLNQDNSCTQTINGIADAIPHLAGKQSSAFGGDTIVWAGKDPNGNVTTVSVQFPKTTPNGATGSPFNGTGAPVFTFKSGQDSGPAPATNPGDFYFEVLTVGNTTCTNPQMGGVHVDQ